MNEAILRLGATDVGEVRLKAVEAEHIARVLDACQGNVSLSASLLGITRRTLQRMFARGLRTRRRRRKPKK